MKNLTSAHILALSLAAFLFSFNITSAQLGGESVWQQLFGVQTQDLNTAAVYSSTATKSTATTATRSTDTTGTTETTDPNTGAPRGPVLTTDTDDGSRDGLNSACARTALPVGLANQTVRCARLPNGSYQWVAAGNLLNNGDNISIGADPVAGSKLLVSSMTAGNAIVGMINEASAGNVGVFGLAKNQTIGGVGVVGETQSLNGIGVLARANGLDALALKTEGAVKIVDGTQGAGKVLTSNADGLASWQTPNEITNGPEVRLVNVRADLSPQNSSEFFMSFNLNNYGPGDVFVPRLPAATFSELITDTTALPTNLAMTVDPCSPQVCLFDSSDRVHIPDGLTRRFYVTGTLSANPGLKYIGLGYVHYSDDRSDLRKYKISAWPLYTASLSGESWSGYQVVRVVANSRSNSVVASCPAGKQVIGGGCNVTAPLGAGVSPATFGPVRYNGLDSAAYSCTWATEQPANSISAEAICAFAN